MAGATTVARVTISRQLEGAPGVSPAVYRIDISPSAWLINADGTPAGDYRPKVTIWRTIGDVTTDITSSLYILSIDESFSLYAITDGDTRQLKASFAKPDVIVPINNTKGVAYRSVRLELRRTANGTTTTVAAHDCSISLQGDAGLPGPVRKPMRISNWDDAPSGTMFYTGSGSSDKFSDVVYRQRIGQKPEYYACLQTHVKTKEQLDEIMPGTKNLSDLRYNGLPVWLPASQFELIATGLFLAEEAVINNLVAQIVKCGSKLGKQIVIDPATQDIKIYDARHNLVATYSGNTLRKDSLLPIATDWQNTKTDKQTLVSQTNAQKTYEQVNILGTITPASNGMTVISADLAAAADRAIITTEGAGQTAQIHVAATATAEIEITDGTVTETLGRVYATSPLWPLMGVDSGAQNQTVQNQISTMVQLIQGKTYTLKSRLIVGYNQTTQRAGVVASASVQLGTLSTNASTAYNAHYFANGFVLSSGNTDYVYTAWDESTGMTFAAENKNGYGIKVDSTGIHAKVKGGWKEIDINKIIKS
ncbi:MAG: hypothetical protein K2N88_05145 [Muribaculaceae bacterium]|nr:hypothetical protein [Muribaculaceae bacterium]